MGFTSSSTGVWIGADTIEISPACKDEVHESGQTASACWTLKRLTRRESKVLGNSSDIYLLALAVRHEARFVTFDHKIPLTAVRRAKPQNLMAL